MGDLWESRFIRVVDGGHIRIRSKKVEKELRGRRGRQEKLEGKT